MLGITEQKEISPGVWDDVITEVPILGRVTQRTERLEGGGEILPRLATTTSIEILNRGVGPQDNSNIAYLTYMGTKWAVATDVTRYPRLVLYLSEKYSGPTP